MIQKNMDINERTRENFKFGERKKQWRWLKHVQHVTSLKNLKKRGHLFVNRTVQTRQHLKYNGLAQIG